MFQQTQQSKEKQGPKLKIGVVVDDLPASVQSDYKSVGNMGTFLALQDKSLEARIKKTNPEVL